MRLLDVITPKMAKLMYDKWHSEGVTAYCRSADHFAQEMIFLFPQLKPFADADESIKYGDYIYFANTLMDAVCERLS